MSGNLSLFPLIVLASYLIGAIPFSYIIPRVLLGTDIRQHGSGNPGASNVSRVCGKGYGGLALVLDTGKGALAALLAQQTGLPVALGFIAVLGHIFNPFLRFSGGKGVATSLGVISFVYWPAGLIFVIIWMILFLLRHIAGLSSLAGISSVPIVFYFTGIRGILLWASIGLVGLIYFTHRGNIARLIKGEERKV